MNYTPVIELGLLQKQDRVRMKHTITGPQFIVIACTHYELIMSRSRSVLKPHGLINADLAFSKASRSTHRGCLRIYKHAWYIAIPYNLLFI
ncbi:hypothetical protein SeMB42_g00131 [Synchytrium endobioticum]|uniref:Uncharacterized protein n=1 Tax=Synchytrium endobioticum TaxID=286115 RepID=A0A507DSZ0_9FUNG|nr:hypothetical protein SeMB42_g00131 [Synchytrium endobioticum]